MSDELFEVAFSGKISGDADLDEVKTKIGKMFKADDAKIAQMFSGKRVVIKRNLDKAAAVRYANAFKKAGAKCEVKPMPGAVATRPAKKVTASPPAEKPATPVATLQVDFTTTQNFNEPAPPPKTDPLGISGDQIEELTATVAPIGSEMQDEIKEVPEPDIDITEFKVAPVGSTIGTDKKEADPPPPDTTGLAITE
jgi:hypothetical protein